MKKRFQKMLACMLIVALLNSHLIAATKALAMIVLPESLKVIDDEAFSGTTSIEKVIIPEGTEVINDKAFADSGVEEVHMPESLEYIASDAFYGQKDRLFYVYEDTYAEEWAVTNRYSYRYAYKHNNEFTYRMLANKTLSITGYTGNANNISLPSNLNGYSVSEIGISAFEGNKVLQAVTIPKGILGISSRAFADSGLQAIILSETLSFISEDIFDGCGDLQIFVYRGTYAQKWCEANGYTPTVLGNGSGQQDHDGIPELDMSSATLDKYTYYPGETIVISGIRVKNAEGIYLYGTNGWLNYDDAGIWLNYSTEMETADKLYLKIPENAANGDYSISVGAANYSIDEFALSSWNEKLEYTIRGGIDVLPELDISETKLNKSVYAPGETIYITGIKYKNSNYVKCEINALYGSATASYTTKSNYFAVKDTKLDIYEKLANGTYELTITAYDYRHSDNPFEECENWPKSETYSLYFTVDDGSGGSDGTGDNEDHSGVPEIDMSSAELDKYTYYPGDTIVISGIKARNASHISFSQTNGFCTPVYGNAYDNSYFTCNIEYSNEWKTYDIEVKLSSNAMNGHFLFMFFRADNEYVLKYSDTAYEELQYVVEGGHDAEPKLDMSVFKLNKQIFAPGEKIYFSGLKYINSNLIIFSHKYHMPVAKFDNYQTLPEGRYIYAEEEIGVHELTITAYDYRHNDYQMWLWPQDTYTVYYTVTADGTLDTNPTVSNYKINNTATELTVKEGDTLSFSGLINAPEGASITAALVSVFKEGTAQQDGEKYHHVVNLTGSTYDLSNTPAMVVGQPFGETNYTMTAGNSYLVMLYTTDSNGNGFIDHDPTVEGPQGPSILVHVVSSSASHEHTPSSTEPATYLFHDYDIIEEDNNYHMISAIVSEVPCATCGEAFAYIDTDGYAGELPKREQHDYSSEGYCKMCGYVCKHSFYDTGEAKPYTGVWDDCEDGTHKRVSLMKYFECSGCGMRELRRISEQNFVPESHLISTEERCISVQQLASTDSLRKVQHQATFECWEYCRTRSYGCSYEKLLSTETRNVEHQFVEQIATSRSGERQINNVCVCGYVQEANNSRENIYQNVDWDLIYYVEHIIQDDQQFTYQISELFGRTFDEICGYLWNVATFDVIGLIGHIWEDVTYAYREEAAMNIIESIAGYGNTDKENDHFFYVLAAGIDSGAEISDKTYSVIEKTLKAWGDSESVKEMGDAFTLINSLNKAGTLIGKAAGASKLNRDQKATLTLLLSDFDKNYYYLYDESRYARQHGDQEMSMIYRIAYEKLEEVYIERAENYIINPTYCLDFDAFLAGIDFGLTAAGVDPVENGLKALQVAQSKKYPGLGSQLTQGAKIALFVHTCVTLIAGKALGGDSLYDAKQKLYDNLTVLKPMQEMVIKAKEAYMYSPTEENKETLAMRANALATYKKTTLDNVLQYREALLFESSRESSINLEKKNLTIYAECVEAIRNDKSHAPTGADPADNGVVHGDQCKVCNLR